MNQTKQTYLGRIVQFLAVIGLGLSFPSALQADVIVLQSGVVVTGNILQQDGNGLLVQGDHGTFRYPQAWIKEVKREAATARHVSNNGQIIPDWAQIVTLLADSGFAPEIKQVPATVINYGSFKNVPYVSFRCAYGGYEINVFGDLNQPAAVQIGAMGDLKDSDAARSNCVNFICSVLANAEARKMVRALNWSHKDLQTGGGLSFETLMPGEWGSYGGWWVSVSDPAALVGAQASDAELLAMTQPRTASAPAMAPPVATATNAAPTASASPVATTTTYGYGSEYGWTAEELAAARAATLSGSTPAGYPAATSADKPADPAGMVYPRTYTRTAGAHGGYRR